jgi:hypothetical protein
VTDNLDVALTDFQREFEVARSKPRHLVSQPKTPFTPRAGLDGLIDSLLGVVIGMFKSKRPHGSARACALFSRSASDLALGSEDDSVARNQCRWPAPSGEHGRYGKREVLRSEVLMQSLAMRLNCLDCSTSLFSFAGFFSHPLEHFSLLGCIIERVVGVR